MLHPADASLMRRALFLATRAGVATSPNPKVGCVIADGAGRIRAEGLFRVDGGPHAEIDALGRLPHPDQLPRHSLTAYVSLEPCSIHGRTPPCADRLVAEGIGRVVVAALDQTPGVCGEGLGRLRRGGVELTFGTCQDLAYALAAPRNTYAALGRPYTILKQAVSADGYVGRQGARVAITGAMANVLSHQWRSECDAILVGVGTVLSDAPSLRTRNVAGRSPHVVVLDPRGGLSPKQLRACFPHSDDRDVHHVTGDKATVPALNHYLHGLRIGRLLVEGGPATLDVFTAAQSWDEYRAYVSPRLLPQGVGEPVPAAPVNGRLIGEHMVGSDRFRHYVPLSTAPC